MDLQTRLIDERIQIKAQMERLKERLDNIDADLKEECEPGEVLLGSEGYGYRLTEQDSLVYGAGAIRELDKLNLLSHFASVSTTKLDALRKKGLLTGAMMDDLQGMATVKKTLVLREFVPEEAKVF